jgi:dihydrofolate reductase
MHLTAFMHMTLDGVVQGGGSASEDRGGGFERGGWAIPHHHPEGRAYMEELFGRADAFLLGRRTYESWATFWGVMAPGQHPVADALNSRPKYLASATVSDPQWAGTTVLCGDLAGAVEELKTSPEGELQVHGSPTLLRWLLAHELVDELALAIYPVIVGQGVRLFPESGPDAALELVDSRSTPKGVTIQTYRVAGRPTYAR